MAPIWHYTKRLAGIGGGVGVFTQAPSVVQVLLVSVVLLAVVFPVVAATVLLAVHSWRGTKPGQGGQMLVELIDMIFGRRSQQ